jgi:threonine-phosphate decarboxylase
VVNLNYKHGGNIYDYNINKFDIIDFSANINPLGYPRWLKDSINESLSLIINYPDTNYIELRKSIAKEYNVFYENIIVGNGGIQLIHNAIEFLDFKNALIISPTFVEYEKAINRFDKSIQYCILEEENDFELDIDKFLKKDFKNIDLVIICNPNNPTGKYIKKSDIIKILEVLNENNVKLILDESFMDFLDNKLSLMNIVSEYKNLIIIRSLTKFFAIPGLRLGFLVTSNQNLIEKINTFRESWNVNLFANDFGIKVFDDKKFIDETKRYIIKQNEFLTRELNNLNLFKVYDSKVNYIFLKSKFEIDWQIELLKYNILIRKCDNYIGLNNFFYRVAVKDNINNKKLIESIKNIKEKYNDRFI